MVVMQKKKIHLTKIIVIIENQGECNRIKAKFLKSLRGRSNKINK